METRKALSVRQPWAWLLAHGKKPDEFRNWKTPYRGPLLIHAAKKIDIDGWHYVVRSGMLVRYNMPFHFAMFPVGGIVGEVNLVGCRLLAQPTKYGSWAWRVKDARAYPLVPMPGKQGLFDVEWSPVGPLDVVCTHCKAIIHRSSYSLANDSREHSQFCGTCGKPTMIKPGWLHPERRV